MGSHEEGEALLQGLLRLQKNPAFDTALERRPGPLRREGRIRVHCAFEAVVLATFCSPGGARRPGLASPSAIGLETLEGLTPLGPVEKEGEARKVLQRAVHAYCMAHTLPTEGEGGLEVRERSILFKALDLADWITGGSNSSFQGAHVSLDVALDLFHALFPQASGVRVQSQSMSSSGPLAALAAGAAGSFVPHHGALGLPHQGFKMGEVTCEDLDFIRRVLPFAKIETPMEEPGHLVADIKGGLARASETEGCGGLHFADTSKTSFHMEALWNAFGPGWRSDLPHGDSAAWLQAASYLLPSFLLQAAAPDLEVSTAPWLAPMVRAQRRALSRSPMARIRYAALIEDFLEGARGADLSPETLTYIKARALEAGLLTGALSLAWGPEGFALPEHQDSYHTISGALASLAERASGASRVARAIQEEVDPLTYEAGKTEEEIAARANGGDLPATNTMERYVWDSRHLLIDFARGNERTSFMPSPWLGRGLMLTQRKVDLGRHPVIRVKREEEAGPVVFEEEIEGYALSAFVASPRPGMWEVSMSGHPGPWRRGVEGEGLLYAYTQRAFGKPGAPREERGKPLLPHVRSLLEGLMG